MRVEFPKEAITTSKTIPILGQTAAAISPYRSLMARLFEKKQTVISVGLIILMAAAFVIRTALKERRDMSSFVTAYQIMDKIKKGEEIDSREIEALTAKHQELRPHLDRILVKQYIQEGNFQKASKIHAQALKRISFLDPLLKRYSLGSLFIEKKEFAEALSHAQELQAELVKDPVKYPRLYFFNLLRIAFLNQKSGGQESKTLQEVERCLAEGDTPLDSKMKGEIRAHLSEGKYSLLDLFRVHQPNK